MNKINTITKKDYKPFKIFVCADMDSKINRCLKRQNENEESAYKKTTNYCFYGVCST